MQLLVFILGLLLVVKGAEWFIAAASGIARATGVPAVIIGATLVSVATTLPELAVSVLAAATGHPEVAVGNAVGSVTANIGLILGFTMVLQGRAVRPGLFERSSTFMVGAGVAVMWFARDLTLSGREGAALLVLAVVFIATALRPEVRPAGAERPDRARAGPYVPAFLAGAATVVVGSRLVVTGGVGLARALGVPEAVIGLTLVAVGTSLPELVTAVTATLKGQHDISVGNIIGANVLDLTWVTGTAALVRPLAVGPATPRLDLPVMLLFMVLLLLFGTTRHTLSRREGAVLFTLYLTYVVLRFTVFR